MLKWFRRMWPIILIGFAVAPQCANAAPLQYAFDLVLGQRFDTTPAIFDGRTVTGSFSYTPETAPAPGLGIFAYNISQFDVFLDGLSLVTGVMNSRGDAAMRILVKSDCCPPDFIAIEGTLNQIVDGYELRAFGLLFFGSGAMLDSVDLIPLPLGLDPDEQLVGRLGFVNYSTGDEVFVDGVAHIYAVPEPASMALLAMALFVASMASRFRRRHEM